MCFDVGRHKLLAELTSDQWQYLQRSSHFLVVGGTMPIIVSLPSSPSVAAGVDFCIKIAPLEFFKKKEWIITNPIGQLHLKPASVNCIKSRKNGFQNTFKNISFMDG